MDDTISTKILYDEDGNKFFPITATSALVDPIGRSLDTILNSKLELPSLVQGSGIVLTKDSVNNTVVIASNSASLNLIDNLTTTSAEQGALDARQGYVLKGLIDAVPVVEVIDNLTTVDGTKALSAYQGYLLSNKFNDYTTTSGLNTLLGNYVTTSTLNTRLNSYLPLAGGTVTGGLTVNGNFSTADSSTNNTTDTWVPVWNNGKLQHRVIPTAYNNDPSTLNVNSALRTRDQGVAAPATGTTVPSYSGIEMVRGYNNGYPTAYGNVLRMGGGGYTELLMGWSGDGGHANVYQRSKRDVASTDWSDWYKIMDSSNFYISGTTLYITTT